MAAIFRNRVPFSSEILHLTIYVLNTLIIILFKYRFWITCGYVLVPLSFSHPPLLSPIPFLIHPPSSFLSPSFQNFKQFSQTPSMTFFTPMKFILSAWLATPSCKGVWETDHLKRVHFYIEKKILLRIKWRILKVSSVVSKALTEVRGKYFF